MFLNHNNISFLWVNLDYKNLQRVYEIIISVTSEHFLCTSFFIWTTCIPFIWNYSGEEATLNRLSLNGG